MTNPQFKVHPTPAGFTVTAGSRTAEFEFGQTNRADENLSRKLTGYPEAPDLDVIRNSRGEFHWEPRAKVKLRMLGLFASFKADGSPNAAPDPLPFLIAAGIVEAPPAPVATKAPPATLEQIMAIPGAKEFPTIAEHLAEYKTTFNDACAAISLAVREHRIFNLKRACNSEFGLLFNGVEL
jgi:hypothetical protein